MRRLLVAFAVLTATGATLPAPRLSAAQTPTATPNVKSTPETGSIVGRVVDAATGAPVDDAIVSLHTSERSPAAPESGGTGAASEGRAAGRQMPVLVNGRGQFAFRNLPPGWMLITVEAPGYIAGGAGGMMPGADPVPIALTAGQTESDVTVRLWRYAAIEGAVLDDTGDPIADVPVHLLERTVGARRMIDQPVVMTDDRGTFRFSSLEPGRYVVMVQSTTTSIPAAAAEDYFAEMPAGTSPLVRGRGGAAPLPSEPGYRVGNALLQFSTTLARDAPRPTADGGIMIYRTTFFPNVPVASQAESIEVSAGDERNGVDITLPLVHTTTVSGVVSDATGAMSGLALRLVPADAEEWVGRTGFTAAWTTADAEGAFTFLGVPPGQFVIEGSTNELWVRSTIAVQDSPVTGLSLLARDNLSIRGRIRFAGSSPVPPLGAGAVLLIPLSLSQSEPFAVAPDGGITLRNCKPGSYAIQASMFSMPGATWAVQSITSNGRDLLRQPLDLQTDVSDLVVTFTDQPSEIAGAVRSTLSPDEPLSVIAFPADYETAVDSGMIDLQVAIVEVKSGRYKVDGLPPGNYLIAAIPQSEVSVVATNAVALRTIASQASPVTLADRTHTAVDLRAIGIR